MSLQETLVQSGFSPDEAKALSRDGYFASRNENKNADDITRRLKSIAAIYNTTESKIRDAILMFPQFADYNHLRVLSDIINTYHFTNEQAASIVLKFPPFVGLNHLRVLNGIKDAYHFTEQQAAKVVIKHPQFAGYNHKRVLNGIKDAYHFTEQQAAKAILKFPQFAGLNHKKVLRHLLRLGDIVGITEEKVKEAILKTPVLASYSTKRYLAALDIGRILRKEEEGKKEKAIEERKEGFNDKDMLRTYLNNIGKSPYVPVPGTYLRISQAAGQGITCRDPALMTVLRDRMTRRKRTACS